MLNLLVKSPCRSLAKHAIGFRTVLSPGRGETDHDLFSYD
jgi:hypothetical protein